MKDGYVPAGFGKDPIEVKDAEFLRRAKIVFSITRRPVPDNLINNAVFPGCSGYSMR